MPPEKNSLLFGKFCFDPEKKHSTKNVFLSHAHADHTNFLKKSTIHSTPETAEIAMKRFEGRANGIRFEKISFGEKKKFDGFELELFPSGHVLGSAQAKIFDTESGNETAITSDFRLKDSLLFKGAKPLHCDTLIIETTFGRPEYIFPKEEEVVSKMIKWISENSEKGLVVLAGYSLGKAQELTKISNEAGIVPIVHESIFEVNKIYEKFGVKLGESLPLNHNLKESSVLIVPPSLVNKYLFSTLEYFDKRKIFSAIATGWPDFGGQYDRVFCLSDHADFNDLISYVKQANPRLVLTDHGFSEEFARKLNKLGFNAKPLSRHQQRILSEF
ncbi:MAG: MBL fold metallo-hydrolase [Candidatus Diapherotrites archaeon]|nr:MBL fold metallo-hydrolase [Candidatus Diapherotrites archaeon]